MAFAVHRFSLSRSYKAHCAAKAYGSALQATLVRYIVSHPQDSFSKALSRLRNGKVSVATVVEVAKPIADAVSLLKGLKDGLNDAYNAYSAYKSIEASSDLIAAAPGTVARVALDVLDGLGDVVEKKETLDDARDALGHARAVGGVNENERAVMD